MKTKNELGMPASAGSSSNNDEIRNEYHGRNSKGLAKLVVNGTPFFGEGTLDPVSVGSASSLTAAVFAYCGSSTGKAELLTDVDIRCFDPSGGQEYRFLGTLRPAGAKAAAAVEAKRRLKFGANNTSSIDIVETKSLAPEQVVNAAYDPDVLNPCQSSVVALSRVAALGHLLSTKRDVAPSKGNAGPVEDSVLILELREIGAARAAGLDPAIKLKHVCVLTGESRATVYRKIANNQFPAPTKRGEGKGSFWRLSLIETYCDGLWQPTLPAGESPSTHAKGGAGLEPSKQSNDG
jgi:predicted DNA-binding transcriptional regulator AlpA